jgi:hypothetical protein
MSGLHLAAPIFVFAIGIIVMLVVLTLAFVSTFLTNNAWALELKDLDDAITNFTRNLQNNISDKLSGVLNYKIDGLNINYQGAISSSILNNSNSTSNISSVQTIQSSNDHKGIVSSQTSVINGVCTNTLIGGDGNNTLSSSGDCDDQFTGGRGADTFSCGVGMDIIRDYNPNEGDVIADKANCETILSP